MVVKTLVKGWNMRKEKKKLDNNDINDEKLSKKIIDLFLYYQIEDSP